MPKVKRDNTPSTKYAIPRQAQEKGGPTASTKLKSEEKKTDEGDSREKPSKESNTGDDKWREKAIADGKKAWLPAATERFAGLSVRSGCMTSADIYGDGRFQLVMADHGSIDGKHTLKIFNNLALQQPKCCLLDEPTAICSFNTSNSAGEVQVVAVAIGRSICIYRNLRPFFKLALPNTPGGVSAPERDLWEKARSGQLNTKTFYSVVESLCSQISTQRLTAQLRQAFRAYMTEGENPTAVEEFTAATATSLPKLQTVVTCMTVLPKEKTADPSASCLVVGMEDGRIAILDPNSFTIMHSTQTSSAPCKVVARGFQRTDYRIFAACRNRNIYTVKCPATLSNRAISCGEEIVDVVMCRGRALVVALMSGVLQVLSFKGRNLCRRDLGSGITCLQTIEDGERCGLAVGMKNGEIHIYGEEENGHLTFSHLLLCGQAPITALHFGQLGLEKGCLAAVTAHGDLFVRIFCREATLSSQIAPTKSSRPTAQLRIPKKTMELVKSVCRERNERLELYSRYTRSLRHLHLFIEGSYASIIKDGSLPVLDSSPTSAEEEEDSGFGPRYLLFLRLYNDSPMRSLVNVHILLQRTLLYKINRPYITIPLLRARSLSVHRVTVEAIHKDGLSGPIQVHVFANDGLCSQKRLVSVELKMPACDNAVETARAASVWTRTANTG